MSLWIPSVASSANRHNSLLGTGSFLVPACPAKDDIITANIQSLSQGFCPHDRRIGFAMFYRIEPQILPFFVLMKDKFEVVLKREG